MGDLMASRYNGLADRERMRGKTAEGGKTHGRKRNK